MKNFNELKKWFVEEESGQGMVEYGLIIVLIAIAVIISLKTVGTNLTNTFNRIAGDLVTNP